MKATRKEKKEEYIYFNNLKDTTFLFVISHYIIFSSSVKRKKTRIYFFFPKSNSTRTHIFQYQINRIERWIAKTLYHSLRISTYPRIQTSHTPIAASTPHTSRLATQGPPWRSSSFPRPRSAKVASATDTCCKIKSSPNSLDNLSRKGSRCNSNTSYKCLKYKPSTTNKYLIYNPNPNSSKRPKYQPNNKYQPNPSSLNNKYPKYPKYQPNPSPNKCLTPNTFFTCAIRRKSQPSRSRANKSRLRYQLINNNRSNFSPSLCKIHIRRHKSRPKTCSRCNSCKYPCRANSLCP